MKVNEIKRTETIEKVIRTEYIAADGTVFSDKDECKKYEESALFVVSAKLNRLLECDLNTINDEAPTEYDVDIFDIQTEEDLKNLSLYVFLILAQYRNDSEYNKKAALEELEKITLGHEVMIIWGYDHDGFYIYGDGSAKAYGNYFTNNILKKIERAKEKKEAKNNAD